MTSLKSITRKQNCTVAFIFASLLFTSAAIAQAQNGASTTVVPTLVNFSGTLTDSAGKPLTGTVGVTFLLYKDEQGGAPLWMETQNVQLDSRGHYSAKLGSTSSQGLPKDVFASGEARWLAVQVQGESERPRVLLLSVPYALKAADAETIGGLPPSAFVLAAPVGNAAANVNGANSSAAASAPPPASSNVTTAGGTVNALPLFSTATDIENSVVTQTGSGATGRIGIGTTTPASTLDVKGNATLRGPVSVMGALTLPSSGAATATAGKISQPLAMAASSFSSTSSAAVNQIFQWQAEPAANDTAAPSGTLNLLFGSGTAKPAETGLNIAANGRITFAPGQVFPGVGTLTGVTTASGSGLVGGGTTGSLSLGLLNTCTKNQTLQWSGTAWACATAGGSGTITGVTAGTDLTGGGTSGTVTLNLDTTKVPQLSSNNSFVGNQNIIGNVNVSGFGEFLAPTGNILIVNQTSSSATGFAFLSTSSTAEPHQAAILGENVSIGSNPLVFGIEGTVNSPLGSGVTGTVSGRSATGTGFSLGSGVWADTGTSAAPALLATADDRQAVLALNNSPAQPAVLGRNFSTVTSSVPLGVVGEISSTTGIGVYGVGPTGSAVFSGRSGAQPFGVVGDAGDVGNTIPIGVWGAADSGLGVIGENNSVSEPAGFFLNLTSSSNIAAFVAGGNTGTCTVTVNGNLTCTGTVAAAVPLSNQRSVNLYAMQSPENWLEDFGSVQLSAGTATVALDPTFAETVSGTDYHVFLTPKGDCKGLYVTAETASGFQVREMGGGQSSVSFDYRIVGKRKGYENIRMADVTESQQRIKETTEQLAAKKKTAPRASTLPGVFSMRGPRQDGQRLQ